MNRKRMRFVFCAAGCLCFAALFAVVLSMQETNLEGTPLADVAFSHPSGFYDDDFYLEIKSDRGKIYYTLDSSDPDENSILYTEPILISDASQNENVYSMIRDVALELTPELLIQAGYTVWNKYDLPEHPIDKATVVRAVSIDDEGEKSETATAVFFVGFDEKSGYDGMNIVTVTTSPKNLFDPTNGIYVLGDAFARTLTEDGLIPPGASSNFMFLKANYHKRRIKWEREAHICFFDTQRNLVLSGNYGIRIQGKGSRALLPKGLNIFARKQYGSATIPCGELLGLDCDLKSLNLNMGGNYHEMMIHDYLVNLLCADLNVGTREYEPYVLFLDGEYWGVYWLTPRYKADYLQHRYNVTEGNQLVIKNQSVEVGKEEDKALYESMMEFICGNDMSDPELYASACEMIDMDSCIDYYAIETYIANSDWPINNCALWRSKEKMDDAYADGRWRWLLFDVNLAMSVSDTQTDWIDRSMRIDPLFASLMDNRDFAEALYDRLVVLAEDYFNPEIVDGFLDRFERMMGGIMEKDYQRFWNGGMSKEDFIKKIEKKREFYHGRYEYIMEQYGERD